MMSEEALSYSGTHNLEVMTEAVNYNRFLLQLVLAHAEAGDRILDFGAGIGTFARQLHESGHDITCVEPDRNQARQLTASGLSVVLDLDQVADDSLDYVYLLNVLEHIEFDDLILLEINRKLRPGGRLLVYVPAFDLLFSSMDRKVGHYRRYTRRGLKNLAHRTGFDHVRTRYCDSLGFLATLVYKLKGDQSGDLNRKAVIGYDRIAFPLSRIGDIFLSRFVGKNSLLVARKAAHSSTR